MPVTFLAHQAPVLPIKRRWPGLDGVALVAGSVVPDLARVTPPFLRFQPEWWNGHSPVQQITFCLPVGLLLTWLVRRLLAPGLAPYLPDAGAFHLQDLRHVARTRHRWWTVAGCVLIGSVSHVLVDGFTHGDGWAVVAFPVLAPVASVLQVVGSLVLSVVTVVELHRIGRARQVCTWSGVAPTGPVRPSGLVAVRVAAAGVLLAAPAVAVLSVTRNWTSVALATFLWAVAGLTVLASVVLLGGLTRGERVAEPAGR